MASAKQLAARKKFVAMVKAKAASKKTTAPKTSVKKTSTKKSTKKVK